jgi:hypothetical protein
MSFAGPKSKFAKGARKKAKPRAKVKRRDPIFIDGARPRPMYVDYKDLELLGKLVRRRSSAVARAAAPPPVSMPSRGPSSGPGSWRCCRTSASDRLGRDVLPVRARNVT